MHVTDWLPTLVSAAGGDPSRLLGNIDGLDQWASFTHLNNPSPRKEMLYNIDPGEKNAAKGRYINAGIRWAV
jgi:arylsulfatase B